jgi:hypothetical protein
MLQASKCAGFCLVSALLLFAGHNIAEQKSDRAEITQAPTRIETDKTFDTIRFIVNGKEVARITAAGMQVQDNISYGGTLTDVGTPNRGQSTGDSGVH